MDQGPLFQVKLRNAVKQHMVHAVLMRHGWNRFSDAGLKGALTTSPSFWLLKSMKSTSIQANQDGSWEHWTSGAIRAKGKNHRELSSYLQSLHRTQHEDRLVKQVVAQYLNNEDPDAMEAIINGMDVEEIIHEATFKAGTQGIVAHGLRLGVHSQKSISNFAGSGSHLGGYKVPKAQIRQQRVKARKSRRVVPHVGRKGRARLWYADKLV
jgi:hypothetical protein